METSIQNNSVLLRESFEISRKNLSKKSCMKNVLFPFDAVVVNTIYYEGEKNEQKMPW